MGWVRVKHHNKLRNCVILKFIVNRVCLVFKSCFVILSNDCECEESSLISSPNGMCPTTASSKTHDLQRVTSFTSNPYPNCPTCAKLSRFEIQNHQSNLSKSAKQTLIPFVMDITYVTERIIVLTFPDIGTSATYRANLKDVMQMLRTKHKSKYMLFNLSEKRYDLAKLNPNICEFGWPPKLAPPLEKLCSICKAIDSWLTWDNQHVVVIHSKGDKGRIGVVISAFMHYIDISSTADQALDRFTMKRFHDDKLAPFMNPSQKRYVHYFAGLLTGAIKMNSNPLYLHNIIIYDIPNFDQKGGCRPFLKIYQGMQPIHTTGIYSASNKKSHRIVIVLNPSIQLRGDILIKCYHKKQSPTGRSTIFSLQFHTCVLQQNRLIFAKNNLDDAHRDPRFSDEGFIEFMFSPTTKTDFRPHNFEEIMPVSDETHDPVARWDSYENFDLIPEDKPDPLLDAFAIELNKPAHTHGPIDGSLYATVTKSPSKKSPVTFSLPNGSSFDNASDEGPHTISIDSGISTLSAQQPHHHHGAITNPYTNGSSSSHPLPINVEVEVHHYQSGAHAKLRPTPEEQAQLDELLSGMLEQAESLPDHPTLKRQTTSVLKKTSQTSPGSKNLSFSWASDTTDSKKQSEYSSPKSIIMNGSDSTNLTSDEMIPSPRYLTRPIQTSTPEDKRAHHARKGGQPFTYGITPSSPAIQRRRVYAERTEYVKEGPPVSPAVNESETSREIDEVFSDYTSSTYQETFSDDGKGLTWLERQQLKLKTKKEGKTWQERHLKEKKLFEELKSVAKRQPTDESSRESSPPYSKPLHVNTSSDSHDYSLPLLPARSSSRNIDLKMYPAKPIVDQVGKPTVQRHRSETSFDRERPFVSVKKFHEQAKNVQAKSGITPQQVAASTTVYGTVYPYSQHHVYMPQPHFVESSEKFTKGGLLMETKNVDEVDFPASSTWSPTSSSDRPPTPGFPMGSRTPYVNQTQSQSQSQSPTLLRKRAHSPNEQNGQGSPTGSIYYGQSQRSSTFSLNEEIISQHPHFVKDTSKYWYKPNISREEAIAFLRNKPPGTFVVRDSNSFPGAFGLALKVATPPPNVQAKSGDISNELVRHFLIEPTNKGVRLKGCPDEPVFGSLSALVYQHSIMQIALPCKLSLPDSSGQTVDGIMSSLTSTESPDNILDQGAACNVLYLVTVDMESLTGPSAVGRAINELLSIRPPPVPTTVHFKVSLKGITLTDNHHRLFFRRHYPLDSITHCGIDPEGRRWVQKVNLNQIPAGEYCLFGFVARKTGSRTDNQCHIFSEFEIEQSASTIVNFTNKVIASSPTQTLQKSRTNQFL